MISTSRINHGILKIDIKVIILSGHDENDITHEGLLRQLNSFNSMGINDNQIIIVERNKKIYKRIVQALIDLNRPDIEVCRANILKEIPKIIKSNPSSKFIINADLCCWYNDTTTKLVRLYSQYDRQILGMFINVSASRIKIDHLKNIQNNFENLLIEQELNYELCPYRGNKTNMHNWTLTYLDGVI